MNRLISHGQATRSTFTSCRVIHFICTSRPPRICELNGKTVLVKLSWADSGQAGELLTGSVDDVKIAIGTVVPSQPDIGAGSLRVCRINLKNRRKREEPGECVIGLKGAEHNREVAIGERQAKTVPLWSRAEGKSFVCAIPGAHPEFVQPSVVVIPEALEKLHRQPAILRRAVRKLMPGPVVDTHRNIDILVDIEWCCEPLGKHVNDVVVGIRTVVKLAPKCGLPFLRLDDAVRIWGMEDEALELKFPHIPELRTGFERGVGKVADAIGALKKPNLWVEVGTDLPVFRLKVEPVGTEVQSGAQIGLPAGIARCAGLSSVTVQNEVFQKNKSAIHAGGLIEAGGHILGSLVDSHHSDVRTAAPQRPFQTQHGIVRPRVGSGRSGIDIHDSQLESVERPRNLRTPVDRNLLSRDGVNPNLAAEKELIRVSAEAHGKSEDARVLQEELPFLWKEQFVWSEIELLNVYIAIGEVRIRGEIRHEIGTEPNLYVDTTSVQGSRSRSQAAWSCIGRQVTEAA